MSHYLRLNPHAEVHEHQGNWYVSLLLCIERGQIVYDFNPVYDPGNKTIHLLIRVADRSVPGQPWMDGTSRLFTYYSVRYGIFNGDKIITPIADYPNHGDSYDRLEIEVRKSKFGRGGWEDIEHPGHIVIIHPS